MLTVLLIDDEYIVLKGIEAMLSNQREVELKIITCMDSVEALGDLSRIQPDVIVTDINMPELDGLSLIEKALEMGYEGRFLLISGYEEVDYYKRAIALHAMEYLVKPIDKRKLMDALCRIAREQQEVLKDRLFRLKLLITLNARLAEETLSTGENGTRLMTQPYTMLLGAQGPGDLSALTRFLNSCFPPVYEMRHGQMTLWVCGCARPIARDALRRMVTDGAAEQYQTEEGFTLRFGVSECRDTAYLIRQAEEKQELPLLPEAVCDWLQHALNLPASPADDPLLSAHLHAENAEATREAYRLMGEALPDAAVSRALSLTLAAECTRQGFLPDAGRLIRLAENKRRLAGDPHGLTAVLSTLPESCHALASDEQPESMSYKIRRAVEYMTLHAAEDLSLGMVADAIGLSPNYLSALFSREVGATFVEYLHRLRMEEACRLMAGDPGLPVEKISDMVGYRTISHFYKTFKEYYGVSPRRWRDGASAGDAAAMINCEKEGR